MTDNEIGKRGVKALSEALKVNVTLASLDMSCEEERKRGKRKKRRMSGGQMMELEMKEQNQ